MSLSDKTKFTMEVVLEETCRHLPKGGDHQTRKLIAEQLLQAAEAGQTNLSELRSVALRASASATKITRQ